MSSNRNKMKKLVGHRFVFETTISRIGQRSHNGGKRLSVMLKDIVRKPTDELVSDHLWVRGISWLKPYRIHDRIKINATVIEYNRADGSIDYTLSCMSDIKLCAY